MKKTESFSHSLGLYGAVLRPVRVRASLAIAVSALSGMAEAMGLIALTPLLGNSDPQWSTILPALIALTVFLIASSLLKLAADALISTVTTRVEARARKELTRSLIFAPWSSVGRLGQGEVTAAVMSESTQVSNGVYALLSGAGNLVVVIILAATAAVVTPPLLAVTIVFIIVSVLVFRSRLSYVRANEKTISAMTSDVGEEISSALGEIKFLRESGSDRVWLATAWSNADQLAKLRRRQILLPSVTRTMIDSLGALFLSLVVAMALVLLQDITLGLVFVALFYRIIPRVQAVQTLLNTAYGQATWVSRWNARMEMLEVVPHLTETGLRGAAKEPSQTPTSTIDMLGAPSIRLDLVSHMYPGRDGLVLNEVNLDIKSGETVAFTGQSGSGKTTLLDLILGLFPPTSGHVLVNETSLDHVAWALFRDKIGLVPQEVPLRRGTFAENIYWGNEPHEEQLLLAIQMAQLEEFVAQLPNGRNTFIDSKTIGLSGGQRQRIALARALFRRPSLLVLDEGTSALDHSTEAAVFDAIHSADWEMTVILVTHRPAGLLHVGRVIELSQGKIVKDQE